jgi:uncharacterized membrane protein YuzA (DUF378 family)
MLEIDEKTLQILILVCAIAAINWGLSAVDMNAVEKVLPMNPVARTYVYYAIAACGVVVIGKMYKLF